MNLSESRVSHQAVGPNCQASLFSGIGKWIIMFLYF
jgi:hypothetical protein